MLFSVPALLLAAFDLNRCWRTLLLVTIVTVKMLMVVGTLPILLDPNKAALPS